MDNYINGSLLIVKKSPYILVPTNFMGSWYHDRGLQVVKEIKTLLVREKKISRALDSRYYTGYHYYCYHDYCCSSSLPKHSKWSLH
jgi:hypothetical protein